MGKDRRKRSVSDVPIFLDDRLWKELQSIIEMPGWEYKTRKELFQLRDRALMCLLILSGLRISEAIRLKKMQFRIYVDRILLLNVKTVKNGLMRPKIVLPKKGNLSFFTKVFEDWLVKVPNDESYVFPRGTSLRSRFLWDRPLSTKRAFWIIKTTTEKFPHWFRAVCENIYGKLIFKNDAWKLKDFMGLKRLDSTTPYVKGSWEDDENKIFSV